RPANPLEVERMFRELMGRRDFRSLPPMARQEMVNYSFDKKWMLIYQDALSERSKLAKKEHSSPEWYTRKLVAKTILSEELENLWVSLRTEPIDWVREFIFDFQGDVALSLYLIKLHDQMGSQNAESASEDVFAKELNTLKCLRCMMNQKLGAERARRDDALYVSAVTGALLSPRLATRRIATETLTFLIVYYCSSLSGDDEAKYRRILKALDSLSYRPYYEFAGASGSSVPALRRVVPSGGETLRFQIWLGIVARTMDGRGKYHNSLVGASDELKHASAASGSAQLDNQLLEYALLTMLLVNTIVEYGSGFRARMQLRLQLKSAGLEPLLRTFQEMKYESLQKQCAKYADMAEADEAELRADELLDANIDFNNPVDLVQNVWSQVQNSEAEAVFVSAMQHFFLNQTDKKGDRDAQLRSLRLLDGLVQNVAYAHGSSDSALGIAMNRLYQGLTTDDMYRKALAEVKVQKKIAAEATAERDEMSRQLSLGSQGLTTRLANEVREQELVLRRTRKLNEELQGELEELTRKHLMAKQEQEMEMRELLIMLNSAGITSHKADGKTTYSVQTTNAQLVSKLQKHISRNKLEARLGNKQLKNQIEPSSRLRALREQMNDIENLARELEMTDFENYAPEVEREAEPVPEVVPMAPPRAMRSDDLEKLAKLRQQLSSLQTELNDIMKFNNSKMFAKQKFLAMDRLRELENNFRDFNIDFDYSLQDAALLAQLVDVNVKARLQEEMDDIARIKADLHAQLRVLDKKPEPEPAVPDILARIESKYEQGKVEMARPSETRVNADMAGVRGVSGMDPRFLTELTKKVCRAEPLTEPAATTGATESVLESVVKKTKREEGAKSAAAPPAPPLPLSHGVLPLPSSGAPPPPPLPPLFGLSVALTGAPPPPPLPTLLGGARPPASPLLPPSPIPTAFAAPALPVPGLFDHYPRPKKKLKQLHWEKVDAAESAGLSFWKTTQPHDVVTELLNKGVLEEIEEIFATKEIRNLATKKKEDVDKVTFLPRDMAQQFGINLHFFNQASDQEVVDKVLRCDRDVLENAAVLEFLTKDEIVEVPNSLALSFLPYLTDYASGDATRPEKEPAELQRPDRLFLELIYNLRHYWKLRMRALRTVMHYERDYDDLVRKLRDIDNAVAQIRDSELLRRIFEIILAVGNYMNDASKQAPGFKLASLLRLGFVKDDKNSMSFLHYVEKVVRLNYPQYLAFLDQLAACAPAAKYSVEVIAGDCHEYGQAIRNVQSLIDLGNLSDISKFHPQECVLKVVSPALPHARKKAELLNDQATYTFKELEKLMAYFGEDHGDPFVRNLFLSKFTSFAADFRRAQRENLQREEELRVYEQRKRLMETAGRAAPHSDATADLDVEDVMDSLLEQLKAAGLERREPTSARKRILMKKQLMAARVPQDGAGNDDDDERDVGKRARSMLQKLHTSNGDRLQTAAGYRQERCWRKSERPEPAERETEDGESGRVKDRVKEESEETEKEAETK
ncbi:actin-binding FH2, partial [Metschnikowia bicuspidata]